MTLAVLPCLGGIMERFDVIIEIGARREPDPYQKTGNSGTGLLHNNGFAGEME